MPSDRDSVAERLQRLLVGDSDVLRPLDVLQPGVLRADAGIVQAGGDAVRLLDHAVLVLQQIGLGAVQHADLAGGKGAGMLAACAMPLPAASAPSNSTPLSR